MLRKRRKWRRHGEEVGGQGSQGEEVGSSLYISKFTARIKCESTNGNYKVSALCESPLFKKRKKPEATQQSNTRGMWNQKRQKSESLLLLGCATLWMSFNLSELTNSLICKVKIITGSGEIFQRAVLSRPP